VVVVLAGCGGSHTTVHRLPQQTVPTSHAPQLVSMRRIDGATYETVVIRTDGSGDVGIFIGERTGTHHQGFRLEAAELARLKRLAGLAARVRQTPPLGSSTPSVLYIVFVHGHVLQAARGHVPRQLAGLTSILSALIDRYA
jgi:hypothetical protein